MVPKRDIYEQISAYRAMTGQQRLQIGFWLNEQERLAELDLIRIAHPDWDEQKIESEHRRKRLRRAGIPENISSLVDPEPLIVEWKQHELSGVDTTPH